ncbi:hypothetical protein ACQKMD_16115 [Viridibacillus sp. NPDC096237]|uniref:hypothetical protein n=1 Tax=Viridibacillus sp. NPDC096237 TaxID=3390721 RepID=UPI003CFFEC0E
MSELKCEIVESIILSEGSKGWKKELNLISWKGDVSEHEMQALKTLQTFLIYRK